MNSLNNIIPINSLYQIINQYNLLDSCDIFGSNQQTKRAKINEKSTIHTTTTSVAQHTIPSSFQLKNRISLKELGKLMTVHMGDGFQFAQKTRTRSEFYPLVRQKMMHPSERLSGENAYSIAEAHELRKEMKSATDLDTLKDIGLISGKQSIIGKRHTMMGEVIMNAILTHPVTDLDILINRQSIIKSFLAESSLANKLSGDLQDIAFGETQLLSFWNTTTLPSGNFFKAYYRHFNSLNQSSLATGFSHAKMMFKHLSGLAVNGGTALFAPLYGMSQLISSSTPELLEEFAHSFVNLADDRESRICLKIATTLSGKIPAALVAIASGGIAMSSLQAKAIDLRDDCFMEASIQRKLVRMATFYRGVKRMYDRLLDYPMITEKLDHFKKLETFIHAQELHPLFELLETSTFDSDADYLFSRGNVLATWHILTESENDKIKNWFESTLPAIGEIDAYLSLASEFKKHEHDEKLALCFAEYITGCSEPQIEMKEIWHPLLNKERAVTNSVAFGIEGSSRNAIVTAPNGAGKSTVLRTVTFSLTLAQTVGIGYGKSIKLTPFSYIKSSMNPPDCMEQGLSLFQAQAKLIGDIESDLKKMPENAFSFFVLDELFTGTNSDQGAALTIGTAKKLGSDKRNISILATHHTSVTELEKESSNDSIPLFKNYKLDFTEELMPTFKFEPGASDAKLALLVASRMGVSEDILKEASSKREAELSN